MKLVLHWIASTTTAILLWSLIFFMFWVSGGRPSAIVTAWASGPFFMIIGGVFLLYLRHFREQHKDHSIIIKNTIDEYLKTVEIKWYSKRKPLQQAHYVRHRIPLKKWSWVLGHLRSRPYRSILPLYNNMNKNGKEYNRIIHRVNSRMALCAQRSEKYLREKYDIILPARKIVESAWLDFSISTLMGKEELLEDPERMASYDANEFMRRITPDSIKKPIPRNEIRKAFAEPVDNIANRDDFRKLAKLEKNIKKTETAFRDRLEKFKDDMGSDVHGKCRHCPPTLTGELIQWMSIWRNKNHF